MLENKDGVVIVGEKPLFLYIAAGVEQYKFSKDNTLTIKARGKNISKAVDVAVILKRDFLKSEQITTDITIGSNEFKKDATTIRVSTIDIKIKKGDEKRKG